MFGFFYAAIGLLFGMLCSLKAKEKQMDNEDWFILGFAFNLPAYIVLKIISSKSYFQNKSDFSVTGCSKSVI